MLISRETPEGLGMKTYIRILAADHCPETHISAHTVPWFIGIDLLQHPILVDADILRRRIARADMLLARFGLAASEADSSATILA
jgi:hypothetical protein